VQHQSRPIAASRAGIAGLSVLVASSAAWLSACGFGDDVMSGMKSQQETPSAHHQTPAELPGPAPTGQQANVLAMTPQQRSFLDALQSAGVQSSSDLNALSIGSYICQARAAKQSDQAVWDFVAPMVRSDVRAPDSHTATADYIRIATDRLC
jgi:hypothetical protein